MTTFFMSLVDDVGGKTKEKEMQNVHFKKISSVHCYPYISVFLILEVGTLYGEGSNMTKNKK